MKIQWEENMHVPYAKQMQHEQIAHYVIYIDQEQYYLDSEERADVIRPQQSSYLQQGSVSIPECKIEIIQLTNTTPMEAAESYLLEMQKEYEIVEDIREGVLLDGWYIYAAEGREWDSGIKEVFFLDNQKGGTFVITSQYFMEAAEGHGVRFYAMIESFEIIEK